MSFEAANLTGRPAAFAWSSITCSIVWTHLWTAASFVLSSGEQKSIGTGAST